MPGSSRGHVEPDRHPGIEVLHSPVQVPVGGGGDEMIMVGHEDDMVDKKIIPFHSFGQGNEEDPGEPPLMKPEALVVGPADQMVGILSLEDTGFAGHDRELARSMPKGALTPKYQINKDAEKEKPKNNYESSGSSPFPKAL